MKILAVISESAMNYPVSVGNDIRDKVNKVLTDNPGSAVQWLQSSADKITTLTAIVTSKE